MSKNEIPTECFIYTFWKKDRSTHWTKSRDSTMEMDSVKIDHDSIVRQLQQDFRRVREDPRPGEFRAAASLSNAQCTLKTSAGVLTAIRKLHRQDTGNAGGDAAPPTISKSGASQGLQHPPPAKHQAPPLTPSPPPKKMAPPIGPPPLVSPPAKSSSVTVEDDTQWW